MSSELLPISVMTPDGHTSVIKHIPYQYSVGLSQPEKMLVKLFVASLNEAHFSSNHLSSTAAKHIQSSAMYELGS